MFMAPTLISRNWGGVKRAQSSVLCLVTKGSLGEGRTAIGFVRAVPSPVTLSSQEGRTWVPAPTKSFPRLQLTVVHPIPQRASWGLCLKSLCGRDEPGL